MPKGVSPLDPTSPVGQFRALVDDAVSVPLVPDEPGFGDYSVWSDEQIEGALEASGGSLVRAAGHFYSALAASYIVSGRSIKTDDLNLDTRQRGKDLFAVAQSYYAQADAADALQGGDILEFAEGPRVPPHLEHAFDW